MRWIRNRPELVTGIILTLLVGIALYLRVYLPYNHVFSGEWIKFTNFDAYYHMRLVDNLLHHFPQRITFDPYTFYPHGSYISWPPLFDYLLAGVTWLIGLGSPSQRTIDVVGVYFPAVLASLTVVPLYFLGKEMFNRWVGLLSAGLIALPSAAFFHRSILGYTDHHIAETLFMIITILFLTLAIKSARQTQFTLNHLWHREWAIIYRTLFYSLLTGIFLALYLLTWVGSVLLIFLIFIYIVIQSIIDHWKSENIDYLGVIGTISMLVALILSLRPLQASWLGHLYLPSFLVAILIPPILVGITRLLSRRNIKPIYYPLFLVGLGIAGLAAFYIVRPSLLKSMLSWFSIFSPIHGSLIIETDPLFFHLGSFSLSPAWSDFATGFLLSLISFSLLVYLYVKKQSADMTLLLVWTVFMLAATIGQRRLGYYLAVNIALLTGYLSWQILRFSGLKEAPARPLEITKKPRKGRKANRIRKPAAASINTRHITVALGALVVFFLVFFPNIGPDFAIASRPPYAPDDAWQEALHWFKENTPDPFGAPNKYYELYEPPPGEVVTEFSNALVEDYQYPESAYGVMCWWDYGHWITRIAHRIPVSSPFQWGASEAARFFITQDEPSANVIMTVLDSKYVVVDYDTAVSYFDSMVGWAGSSLEKFFELYYRQVQGKLTPMHLFYPEYYQSLAARLYLFDGAEVIADSAAVISYAVKVSPQGNAYKEITSFKSFSSYEEARNYAESKKDGNYRIVGTNPFVSPVPLAGLEHYRLIYASTKEIVRPEGGKMPMIKIFEYVK